MIRCGKRDLEEVIKMHDKILNKGDRAMIKIKEFTRKINELGFKVNVDDGIIKVVKDPFHPGVIAVISNGVEKMMDVNLYSYERLDEDTKTKIFDLVTELARTPIEDRKDEDKYFLRHKYLSKSTSEENYLNYYWRVDKCKLDNSLEINGAKTKFTLKEIQDMSVKLKSNLSDFEVIKVEE